MPTIPEYAQQLRERRNQLETVRNQVSNQQFQKPIVQQRVLRQLTPLTSLKLRRQIKGMRGEFELSKRSALSEIDKGFAEQEQLESEFQPYMSQYEQQLSEYQGYEQAKKAYAKKVPIQLVSGAVKKYLKEFYKGQEKAAEAPQLTVSMGTQEAQLLPGVIVRDYGGKKAGAPLYISPDSQQAFASFKDLTDSFQMQMPSDTTLLQPNSDLGISNSLGKLSNVVIKSQKPVTYKMLGIRPTNINMLGRVTKKRSTAQEAKPLFSFFGPSVQASSSVRFVRRKSGGGSQPKNLFWS